MWWRCERCVLAWLSADNVCRAPARGGVKVLLNIDLFLRAQNRCSFQDAWKPSDGCCPSGDHESSALPHEEPIGSLARITEHAAVLSAQLRALSTKLFPPSAVKALRSLSSGEVAIVVLRVKAVIPLLAQVNTVGG